MTATALQLASAMQALANGGERMQPYVVSQITDRFGQTSLKNRPEGIGQVVSEEVANATIDMMATVMEEGGTGTRAVIPGYTAAGKTGTAQKVVDGRYSPTARVASFMGVAPAVDPQIVIVVMTDTPREGSRYGGTVSGPAFKEIGRRSLRHLGIPEDRPDEPDEDVVEEEVEAPILVAAPELTWTAEGAIAVPDLGGMAMRDVLVTVEGSGLELALLGTGRVVEQAPAAGTALLPGETLQVTFGTL
jgi:cell division protein FtsI (penicillin-binding protein 3)